MSYTRFAVYYVPPEGALALAGAGWLGWDIRRAKAVAQPDLPGLAEITEAPQKYGFHGTLKPPFRLAEGRTPEALVSATADLAARTPSAACDGLELSALGRFLALVPRGDASGLADIAASCVGALDDFRAAPSEAELSRRQKPWLKGRQRVLLAEWGYPYVMEEFRFHLTLTGKLPKAEMPEWEGALRRHLPALPQPFRLEEIALCAERADGRFEVIESFALAGRAGG